MAEKPFEAYEGPEPYFFVSYAHGDANVVYPEMQWLRDAGYNLWYDDGIHVGHIWRRALANALANAEAVLFFCTEQSTRSDNCLQEINFALEEGKQVFVIQLDDAPLPPELRLTLSLRQSLKRDPDAADSYRRKLQQALGPPPQTPGTAVHADKASPSGKDSPNPGHLGWPSVTILPPRVRGDGAELAELAQDLMEELASCFQDFQWKVAKGSRADAELADTEIGQRDDTRLTLRARLTRRGDEVEVACRLMNAATGEQLGRHVLDASLDAVDEVQIASKTAMRLYSQLRALEGEKIADLPIDTLDAFACVCRRSAHAHRASPSRETLMENVAVAKRAIELAPDKAHCYADAALMMIGVANILGVPNEEVIAWGLLDYADRGVQLSPHDQFCLLAACWAQKKAGDPSVGLEFAERAYRRCHTIFMPHVQVLIQLGRTDEAVALGERGDINPEEMGTVYMVAGQPATAAEMYRKSVAEDSFWMKWMELANALASAGKIDDAREAYARGLALNPRFSFERWEQGIRTSHRDDENIVRPLCDGLRMLQAE